jgi:hypothetical protein
MRKGGCRSARCCCLSIRPSSCAHDGGFSRADQGSNCFTACCCSLSARRRCSSRSRCSATCRTPGLGLLRGGGVDGGVRVVVGLQAEAAGWRPASSLETPNPISHFTIG